jgi:hypothetical protein
MKRKQDTVDAEFTDVDYRPRRPSGSRVANVRRRSRGHWVTVLAVGAPLGLLKLMLWVSSGVGMLAGEAVRVVAVPVARLAAIAATFGAMCLGIMWLGAYAIRGGVAETRALADRAHASLTRGTDALLAMVPGHEPDRSVPRAVPISPEIREDGGSIGQAVASAAEFVEDGVNLLLPPAGRYPQIEGLPRIEGEILERAGGHRMQELVSGILESIEQVESSGRHTLIGDNGKAFGPLQVRREPCQDLAQFFGIAIDPRRCNGNYELSEYVVRLYLGYWGMRYEQQTGYAATAEVLCRTWNGGPDQGPPEKTDVYWAKCQSHNGDIAQLVAR